MSELKVGDALFVSGLDDKSFDELARYFGNVVTSHIRKSRLEKFQVGLFSAELENWLREYFKEE